MPHPSDDQPVRYSILAEKVADQAIRIASLATTNGDQAIRIALQQKQQEYLEANFNRLMGELKEVKEDLEKEREDRIKLENDFHRTLAKWGGALAGVMGLASLVGFAISKWDIIFGKSH